MYKKHDFSARLKGSVVGTLWSGYDSEREVNVVLDDDKNSLSRAIKEEVSKDFQDGTMSEWSYLEVTLIKFNRRITRYFDLSMFS